MSGKEGKVWIDDNFADSKNARAEAAFEVFSNVELKCYGLYIKNLEEQGNFSEEYIEELQKAFEEYARQRFLVFKETGRFDRTQDVFDRIPGNKWVQVLKAEILPELQEYIRETSSTGLAETRKEVGRLYQAIREGRHKM